MSDERILFDYDIFKKEIPLYKNMPEDEVQVFWDIAIFYISDVKNYGVLQDNARRYAINLFTAHLIYTQTFINEGEMPSIETAATVDNVSTTSLAPPAPNQFQYQLGTSPFGQLLMLLLSSKTASGWYISSRRSRQFRGCF